MAKWTPSILALISVLKPLGWSSLCRLKVMVAEADNAKRFLWDNRKSISLRSLSLLTVCHCLTGKWQWSDPHIPSSCHNIHIIFFSDCPSTPEVRTDKAFCQICSSPPVLWLSAELTSSPLRAARMYRMKERKGWQHSCQTSPVKQRAERRERWKQSLQTSLTPSDQTHTHRLTCTHTASDVDSAFCDWWINMSLGSTLPSPRRFPTNRLNTLCRPPPPPFAAYTLTLFVSLSYSSSASFVFPLSSSPSHTMSVLPVVPEFCWHTHI